MEASDQRRHHRVEVTLCVKLRFADVNRFRVFTTQNLSEGGVFVVCTRPAPPGAWVQVVLYPPGIDLGILLHGRVIHSVMPEAARGSGQNPGMGVAFEDLDDDVRESLVNLVNALRDSPQAEAAPASPPPPPLPAADDRRSNDRIATRAAVRLRFADAKVFREFYTKDLSRGGVFVCTPQPLAAGSQIEILLTPPDNRAELRLEGRVVRTVAPSPNDPRTTPGMGIEFTELTLEKRAEISRYFEEVAERRTNLGRVRSVATAHVRYEAGELARVVRSELRHRVLFVPTEEPRTPGSPVRILISAPQLRAPLEVHGEIESVIEPQDAAMNGGRPGMRVRISSLTDERLADLELLLRPPGETSAPAAMPATATPPAAPLPGSAKGKASMLAEAAVEDWKNGRAASAVSNLKLALTFDPGNARCRALLNEYLGKSAPSD